MSEAMKGIDVIKKHSITLPRHPLVTIYESFVRPHLDYGDIMVHIKKIEGIQYNAALAITCAIKGTSQSKLYNELDFESVKYRRWFQKL